MEQKIKFPRSEKVYISGKLFPDIRVAMRKVEQVPSTTFNGDEKIITPNPKYMYTIPVGLSATPKYPWI